MVKQLSTGSFEFHLCCREKTYKTQNQEITAQNGTRQPLWVKHRMKVAKKVVNWLPTVANRCMRVRVRLRKSSIKQIEAGLQEEETY